jgi:lipopolysaccharide export system protein LptA
MDIARRRRNLGCLLVFALLWLSAGFTLAQRPPTGPVKGFRFPDYYGAEVSAPNRMKSLLMSQEATPMPNGTIQVKGLRLENYLPDGKTNLIVESPACLFDPKSKNVSSPGALQVSSGDGLLSIQGQSFLYRMTNASLVISNRPHTVIQQEQKIEIDADYFEYNSNAVFYAGGVKMRDPEVEMTGESVYIVLNATTNLAAVAGSQTNPAKRANAVRSLTAEKNVTIFNAKEGSRISGDHAEYKTVEGREIIEITGQPAWKQKDRQGTADVLQMERGNKTFNSFKALGHSATRLPGADLKRQLAIIPSMQAQTNAVPKEAGTVEILSDSFHLREGGASFEGHVKIDEKPAGDTASQASCDRLFLENISQKGEFGSLTMEGNVALIQGKSQAFGRKLVYNATNAVAELTGESRWTMGVHTGSADLLRFHSDTQWIEAQNHAKMNIQASEDLLSSVIMASQPLTNSVVTNKTVRVESARYDLKPGSVAFTGGVFLESLQERAVLGTMRAEQLFLTMTIPGNKIERLMAETNVVVEHGTPGVTNGPSAFQRIACAKLTAAAKDGNVVNMVADGGVQWHHPKLDASGKQLVYIAAQDAFVLLGDPVIQSGQARLRGPSMVFDRKQQKFFIRGSWTFGANIVKK